MAPIPNCNLPSAIFVSVRVPLQHWLNWIDPLIELNLETELIELIFCASLAWPNHSHISPSWKSLKQNTNLKHQLTSKMLLAGSKIVHTEISAKRQRHLSWLDQTRGSTKTRHAKFHAPMRPRRCNSEQRFFRRSWRRSFHFKPKPKHQANLNKMQNPTKATFEVVAIGGVPVFLAFLNVFLTWFHLRS